VIDIHFNVHIEISSARHVFLFAGRPETRLPGFFALAFGHHGWALILLDPENPHKSYEVRKVANYQSFPAD
jgi:hypothetical protein